MSIRDVCRLPSENGADTGRAGVLPLPALRALRSRLSGAAGYHVLSAEVGAITVEVESNHALAGVYAA